MQTGRCVDANTQTKPTDLGCESANKQLLPSTSIVASCCYYSARKLILFYCPTEGGVDLGTAVRMCRQCPRMYYCSGCRDKYHCPWPLTLQPSMLPLDRSDLQRHMGVNNLPKVVKPKFHYASWFEAHSKLVADRFEAKFHYAIWFEAGCRQVRSWSPTSFEPASVMEFGF